MSEITIEWAPFTIADGVTEEELLAGSEALQTEFLAAQEGFMRRELLRGEGRRWCDLVYWRDPEAARRAAANAMESAVCLRYFHLMVPADADPEANVEHFALRRTYGEPSDAPEARSESESLHRSVA
jgi:hypothetical protein